MEGGLAVLLLVDPPPQRHRGLVVVTPHADPSRSHRELQGPDRIGALVHQVTDEDEKVASAFAVFVFTRAVFAPSAAVLELVEELPELRGAAVDVADDDDAAPGRSGLGRGVEDGVNDGRERIAFFFFFLRGRGRGRGRG